MENKEGGRREREGGRGKEGRRERYCFVWSSRHLGYFHCPVHIRINRGDSVCF